MNAGVFTTPCGVVSTPRRAAPCVCVTSNWNIGISTSCPASRLRHGYGGSRQSSPVSRERRRIARTILVLVKKLRVGIIYGGRSGEHEVSIASAAAVVQNLDKQRYEA